MVVVVVVVIVEVVAICNAAVTLFLSLVSANAQSSDTLARMNVKLDLD